MAESRGGHCSRLRDSTAGDVPRTLAFRHPVLGAMERGGVEAEGGGKAGNRFQHPRCPLNSKEPGFPLPRLPLKTSRQGHLDPDIQSS